MAWGEMETSKAMTLWSVALWVVLILVVATFFGLSIGMEG